ncbi:hypothetical protein ACFQBQ_10580 [Granulicella cerasi]|uniref:DUF1266 domain-containing protein n=1 Tax=Granulicella cerasi TaxID=741063 RepID=A0ABW1ZAZ4_9BACT|nr:hypothetical protein [Granulicella cerasi]
MLKLLFSRNYWKVVLNGQTWRDTRRAAARLHKDKRAWKPFWRALYLLLLPFSIVVTIVGICLALAGGAGFVLIWVYIGVMFVLGKLAWGGQPVKRAPSSPGILPFTTAIYGTAEPSAEVLRELREMCLVHAVFAERASSERFVQTKELPEGMEVITRRMHIDILREHGIYDRLRDNERTLLLMPQGHWPAHVINGCSMALEPLRLFRWVLRMDTYLETIGEHLEADYKLSRSIIDDPASVFVERGFVSADGLQTAIKAASHYGYRCWSECVYRGLETADNEEQTTQARDYALALHGKEGEDFLLNNVIASRAPDADVQLATTLAYRRKWVLEWIEKRWKGVEGPMEFAQLMYAPYAGREDANE